MLPRSVACGCLCICPLVTLQTPTEDHPSNPQYYIYTLCLSLKFLKSSKFTSQKMQLAIHTLEMGRVKQAMLPPFHTNAGRGVKSVAHAWQRVSGDSPVLLEHSLVTHTELKTWPDHVASNPTSGNVS